LNPTPLRLRDLLERLVEAEVQFVLVGGLAMNAWGYMRATQDVDVVPDPDRKNLEKLDALLTELGGRVDVGGRLLDADSISTFLLPGDRTLVRTDLGQVDVLQGLPQIPRFDELDKEAREIDMKGASDRPRDRDDLAELEAAQEDDADQD
jgi:hypothetical protein